MKFCDRLQKVRRENNVTQEQLADKLNVSRQAVSKWESGVAYPDTEKMIQISKLFNVSLDELINDSSDTTKKTSKKKFNFMETFDMLFEAISKVWNMFFAMKFWEKIKFIFEMAFVILAIYLASLLVNEIILGIIRRIFSFLPYRIYNIIDYLIYTILYVVWIIIGVMFFVRILKVRYLDYYVIIKDDTIETPVIEEPIEELQARQETKIVIRDPHDSSASIFKKIAKLLVIIFKCFCLLVSIPIVLAFIFFIVLFVASLIYSFDGLFFNGVSLAISGIILFIFLMIRFMANVIFNQNISYSKMFIIFIVSLSLLGIGMGMSLASLNTFKIYNESDLVKEAKEVIVPMKDNLIIYELLDISEDKIFIDDNLNDIKLVISTYNGTEPIITTHLAGNYHHDSEEHYEIVDISYGYDNLKMYQTIIEDFKNRRLNNSNYYNYSDIDKIYISKKNLTKIKENYQKISN